MDSENSETAFNEFLEKVNQALKDGWQLYGNPFNQTVNNNGCYNQALIKYKENERSGGFGFSRRE